MANILLTGGRAPATLDLARSFHASGHTVFLAESLRGSLTAASNATRVSFIVPPPRQQPVAFVEALAGIIQQQQIDLLVPTCEEIFYVAMGRETLGALCTVFTESIERLRLLHNKWAFIQTAGEMGLPVPETQRVETEADLHAAFQRWPRLVLKPVYSRFSARTLILPPASPAFSSLKVSPTSPWVAQQYLAGPQLCTYSVAHAGRLTAHAAYRSIFTAGQGVTIHFQHEDHPASLAWVRRFVEAFGFSGQIAFDFIESPPGSGEDAGKVWAIECNPRATSGIHLLAADPRFPAAFFDPEIPCLFPPDQPAPMLGTAMLLYGLPAALKKRTLEKRTLEKRTLEKWWEAFCSGRDVIFQRGDARPTFAQWRGLLYFVAQGWRHGITPLAASTLDIEWNGGP